MWKTWAIVLMVVGVGIPVASGITPTKIIPPDGAAGDCFGLSGWLGGDSVLIGAPLSDDEGVDSGSLYVYRRQGAELELVRKATATDGKPGDMFGRRMSVYGDYAVIGAPADSQNGMGAGSAYMFQRVGEDWVQRQKLLAPNGAAGDNLAWSVGIQGSRTIVGAGGHEGRGSAFVYRSDQGVWNLEAELKENNTKSGDFFGHWVAIEGDVAVVGAIGTGGKGPSSGSAYIFRRLGGLWTQEAELVAPDGGAYDIFGSCVAIEGDCIAIGAYGANVNGLRTGAVYMYERENDQWSFEQKVLPHSAEYNYFGNGVSLSNGLLMAGAYRVDPGAVFSGADYAFRHDVTGWHEVASFDTSGNLFQMPGEDVLSLRMDLLTGYPNDPMVGSGSVYLWQVPEPGSLCLFVVGYMALLKRRTRKA